MKKIIMIHGLPGTGKSYIANKITSHFPNTIVLKTARFRERLETSSTERFDETNPNTRKEKDTTYKQLLEAAKKALEEGKMPVLDATFHKRYRRQWAYDLAKEIKAKLIVISVSCNEKTIFDRLKKRKSNMSEDTFLKSKEAYAILKSQADPLEKDIIVKYVNSEKLNIDELITWLKNTSP